MRNSGFTLVLFAASALACSSEQSSPSGAADAGSNATTGGQNGGGGSNATGGRAVGGSVSTGGGSGSTGTGGSSNGGSSGGGSSSGGSSNGGSGTGGAPTNPDSGISGYPDATNTGPKLANCPGGQLTKYTGSGDYRPSTNEVVSCMEFDDKSIYVSSSVSNVTIENCLFVTTTDRFINIQGANVTIRDSRFQGPAGTWIRNSYSGDHLTIVRNDFSGMANAAEFGVGYETLEDNYVHDFGNVDPSQHADGLQTDGTAHLVIRHNTVLLNDVYGATGAIAVMGDAGDDVLVERNMVAGGGYTIYPGGPNYTNIRFVDNCFSTVFYPGQAKTGAYNAWYPSNNPPGLVRTGNTWCDGPNAGQALDDNP
jgi:hypothetical protein